MSHWERFKGFVQECRRVLKVTRKPTKEEFKTIVKVTGLGIAVIGLIGLAMHMMNQLLIQQVL